MLVTIINKISLAKSLKVGFDKNVELKILLKFLVAFHCCLCLSLEGDSQRRAKIFSASAIRSGKMFMNSMFGVEEKFSRDIFC
jgi:hypothetical protein